MGKIKNYLEDWMMRNSDLGYDYENLPPFNELDYVENNKIHALDYYNQPNIFESIENIFSQAIESRKTQSQINYEKKRGLKWINLKL